MYATNNYSDKFKQSLIGKVPSWVWMILFGLFSIGGSFYLNQTTLNLMPYQTIVNTGATELGNLIWMHFILAPFTVLIFELIAFVYGQFVVILSKGAAPFSRKDFVGTFRVFYLLVFVASGFLQIMCYYNALTVVWYKIFGITIPRLITMCFFFWYLKKQYLDASNTHIVLKAVFIPYFVFEIVSVALMVV